MEGLHGGRALPRPPSGSRMAADQVSVWGSASCRQGFRLPWGGDRRLEALLFHRPFQKHFTNALSHCLTALSAQPRIVTDPSWRKRNAVCSLTFVLSWHKTCSCEIAAVGKETCFQTYRRNTPLLSSFQVVFTS